MDKNAARKLIQAGKVSDAIAAIRGKKLDATASNSLSIIEAEHNNLQGDILKGVISEEQKLLRQNRINDKLLALLDWQANPVEKHKGQSRLLFVLLPLILLLAAFGYYSFGTQYDEFECPKFADVSNNKILLLPFENVGTAVAQPHILLRDQIDKFSIEKGLSTSIELGATNEGMTIKEAPQVAKSCGANAIIWGKYSNTNDSLRLILQYHFLDSPDWSNMSELLVFKDVTAIQSGQMLKNLEDAILSLCGIIAVREDKKSLAQKWLGAVDQKDAVDRKLIQLLK